MSSEKRSPQRNFGIASLFTMITLVFLLAGCDAQLVRDSLSGPDDEPVTIRYVSGLLSSSPDESAPEEAAIERFNEHMPGITIDREPQQHGLSHYLSESPPPDVVMWYEGHELRHVAQQNQLSDLTHIWAENDFGEAYGRQFREVGRFDGTYRFVPIGFSWTGIYYNKEVFEQYGLVPPATWEEFENICDTLLVNGETPLSLAGQDPFASFFWFSYLNARLNGPSFHRSLIEGEVSYTDERLALVWETWINLFRLGYFIENPGQTNSIGSMNALIRGDATSPLTQKKAVMTLAPHFLAGGLSREHASELDFFQFPQMNPDVSMGEISIVFGYVIPTEAVNQPAAGEFVGYMGSAEAQRLLMGRISEDPSNAGYVPMHRDVEQSLLSVAAGKGREMVRGADEVLPSLPFALPASMVVSFTIVIEWMFRDLESVGNEIDVFEIQSILEESRQQAFQQGEYRQ
ncbi:MAG: ABC transporter substrate-binding protein [Caldilineaceae bacterium]|nr:ABC transporter substrate-binding protein [Caldilineaceae bacterium]